MDANEIKVIVADGDPLARRLLVETLRQRGLRIVGAARDGAEGFELARHYRPDILLTEVALPGLDAVTMMRRLAEAGHGVKPVVLTVAPDDELALSLLRHGAHGVLSKDIEPDALVRALAGVHAGEAAISRRLVALLVQRLRRMPEPGRGLRPVRSPLTRREWEVLDLVAGGATQSRVADVLVVSDETVSSHMKSIRRKLGARSQADVVRTAHEMLMPG